MRIDRLPLGGAHLIVREPYQDPRGRFARLYCRNELGLLGIDAIAQVNHSVTRLVGTVRGMHFQHAPHAENKLITCLKGRVFDVIVDLRGGSPTFLHWHGVELCAQDNLSIHVPRGFAHGFQVLEPDSELHYVHDAFYAPDHEAAVNATDPRIAVTWPLAVSEVSDRDRGAPFLGDGFTGVSC
jgi:dTDP-4-dehydrorhamnose 3,5-epimerase